MKTPSARRLFAFALLVVTAAGLLFTHSHFSKRQSLEGNPSVVQLTTPDKNTARREAAGVAPEFTSISASASVVAEGSAKMSHGGAPEPVEMRRFDGWASRYLSASPRERESLEAEGVLLAKARRPVMKALVVADPERALALAVSPAARTALPASVLVHVEREVAGAGTYGVLAICTHSASPEKADENHAAACRIEREAIIGDEVFTAHVYGQVWKEKTRENLELSGVALDKDLALAAFAPEPDPALEKIAPVTAAAGPTFDPASPPSGTAPPTIAYNEYTGAYSHQYGPKTMMVFLIQTSDGGTFTNPPSFATLDSQLNDASQWYYDASYRQTWFGPKYKNPGTANELLIPRLVVTPLLQLPQTSAFYRQEDNFFSLQQDCLAAARALGGTYAAGQVNDYANFDRWVPMCNVKLIGSTGLAYVGGSFAWVGNGLNGNVAIHEWGHNWGVFHANFWDPASTGVARAPGNGHGEYGDGADIMGGGGGYFNTLFMESLGFLRQDRDEIVRAQSSGTYRLFNHIDAYSKIPESNTRGLIVPITGYGNSDKRLLLGFRRDNASDQAVSRAGWNRNGVEIHSDNTSANFRDNDGSHFLDTTPRSRATDDRDDGAVFIGRTYSEPAALNGTQLFGGFHITPTARGSVTDSGGRVHEYIDVRVNYGNDVAPANAAPTALIGLSAATPGIGQSVNLTATINDPDGDATASYWNFGDGTRSLNAQPVQTKIWTSGGIYEVALEVSDMKGRVTPVSRFVNVGNQPYRDPEAPAATLAGLNYRYFTGTFNSVPDVTNLFPVKEGTVATFDISPRESGTNFVFEYTGYIQIPAADVYVFSTRSEDGSKFYIGSTLVVNNDGDRSATAEVSGNIALKAGLHAVRLVMAHKSGAPDLLVSWRSASVNGGVKQAIPASALRQIDWAINAAPAVSISLPAAGAEFPAFSSIQFQASATDANGVAKVQYFVGSSYLGQSAAAPYTFTWESVGVGSYQITAIAYDSTGRWMKSSAFTVTVVQPPPSNLVGVKFLGDQSSLYAVAASEIAGAYYQAAYWNSGASNSATLSNLLDQTGTATSLRVTWDAGSAFTTTGTATDAQARLMKTGVYKNGTASFAFSQIPYLEYDVYVYADATENSDNDVLVRAYTIGGTTRYAQVSVAKNDGMGDYPSYDTWAGFREATATAAADPIAKRLGNYLVFRGLSGSSFTLATTGVVNAVQVVESPSGIPRVLFAESGHTTAVTEGGTTDAYTAVLSVAPTANVTVTLTPDAQLAIDRTTLTFTPSNWNVPQSVTVAAVNDSSAQGNRTVSITHAVSGTGNYAAVTARTVGVAITDNDTPTVTVNATGTPLEAATPTAATYRFARSGAVSNSASLTVAFQMSGTASPSADYTLSGASVSYNSGTGAGTVVIPAGQGQVFLTLTPVNDASAEGIAGETALLTLPAGSGYALGTPSTATLTLGDDDSVDYFVQYFAFNQPETTFDLANRKLTFTPNGSTSYYAATLETVSGYPTAISGHADLSATALTFGELNDGYWTYALASPFNFYGANYSTIYVSTNGGITFSASGTDKAFLNLTSGHADNHFGQRRIAGFWRNLSLNPASGSGGGNLYSARISTAGQQRTVFTWHAVKGVSDSQSNSFQIELWDSGKITIAWLACGSNQPMIGLSNRTSTTLPSGFVASNLSGYPALSSNTPPTFASSPPTGGTSGSAYSYAVVANDADNNALSFIATQKPAWLTLTDNGNRTATLGGTPPAAGTYDVALQVADGTATAVQNFSILVVSPGGNTAPAFTSTPASLMASAGVAYSYAITTTDADGHRLAITAPTKPGWLTLTDHGNGTATLAGTPPAAAAGVTHAITLQVGDGLAAGTQSFGLFVQAGPKIIFVTPGLSRLHLPDVFYTLVLEAAVSDDGYPQSSSIATVWSIVSGPAGATFDSLFSRSTVVRFTQNGSYVVRLSASDGAVTTTSDLTVDVGGTGYGPPGLIARYYANTSLLGAPAVTRTDARIESASYAEFPPAGMSAQNYSTRWSGTVTPLYSETYSFVPATDDGVRLWINGVLVSDDWRNKGSTDSPTTPITLTGGVPVPIVMEYYQGADGRSAKLDWSSASQTRQIVPSSAFNTYAPPANQVPVVSATGVTSESVPPATFVTLVGSASDEGNPNPPATLDTLWTKVSGPGNVTFENAATATTQVSFSNAGVYVLRLTADDGQFRVCSDVRVSAVEPAATTYSVSGVITGTTESVTVTDGYRTTTSTGGETNTYALTGVPAGTWILRATAPGASFSPNGFTNPVVVSGNVTARNFAQDGVVKYSISGLVTDLGNPVVGATLTAGATSGITDTRGGYHLAGLSAGTYTVTPNSGGFVFAPTSRGVAISNASVGGQDFATTTVDTPPTVANAASASPNPVTGTTANLSVLGADQNGEPLLTYVWSTVGVPPAAVGLGAQGTNGAKNSVATFTKAGAYTLRVTITDTSGGSVSSDVAVTVQQTPTSITVTPATPAVGINSSQQFAASANDQFGAALAAQPTFTWNVTGGGTINSSSGLFTAGNSAGGPFTVTAASGAISGTTTVSVSTQTILIATADAFMRSGNVGGVDYQSQNFGADPFLRVKSDSVGYERQAYLKFDTTAVTGATGAKIRLFMSNSQPDTSAVNASIYAVSGTAWTEGTGTLAAPAATGITYATKPALGAKLATTAVVNDSNSWYEWDVSAHVLAEKAAGRHVVCFALLNDTTTPANQTFNFNARESATNKPQLSVAVLPANAPPTVATAASATPNPVSGTTSTLAVLGADDSGESSLTYTWATTGTPPAAVTFGANGTNATKSTTATFTQPGAYTVVVTIRDAGNLTVTSSVVVNVTASDATFSGWLSLYPSLGGASAAPTADPDGDGVANLLEYALGGDPTAPDPDLLPVAAVETVASASHLTLTYAKDTSKLDLLYQVQSCDNLTASPVWSDVSDTLIATDGDIEQRKASLPLDGTRKFLRLKITQD